MLSRRPDSWYATLQKLSANGAGQSRKVLSQAVLATFTFICIQYRTGRGISGGRIDLSSRAALCIWRSDEDREGITAN